MTRFARSLSIVVSLWSGADAAAQEFEIGEHGARVELSDSWTRQTVVQDFGDYQFTVEGGLFSRNRAFLVVVEMEALLESEADYDSVFRDIALVGHDAKIEIQQTAKYTRASKRTDAEVSGLSFTYHLEILSRDGLAYYVFAWAMQSQRDFLAEKVGEFLAGFQFPGRDSEWEQQTRPVEKTVSVQGYDVSFSVRPFAFREQPLEDEQLINLTAADSQHLIVMFDWEGYSRDEVLEVASDACRDGEDFVEVSRRDLQISGLNARLLIAKDNAYSYHLLAMPLDDGRMLDVRHISRGAHDAPREDRDLLLRTLSVKRRAEVISLPEPVASEPSIPLDRHTRTVFDRSRLLGDTGLDYPTHARRIADGRWLSLDWSSATLLAPGEPAEPLIADDKGLTSVTAWGGRWLAANAEEEVRDFRDGSLRDLLPFAGRCITSFGENLLVARTADQRELPGLSNFEMGSDVLVQITPAGVETEMAKIPHAEVTRLVTNSAGTAALLLASDRPTPWGEPYPSSFRCLEVDLRDGSVREIGAWHGLETIGPSDRGWLVTGRPQGLPRGIYSVTSDGRVTALLTGEGMFGVELTGGELVYASDLESHGTEPFVLYQVPVDEIAAAGPLRVAFSTERLNTIGRRITNPVATSGAPRTEQDLRGIVTSANGIAEELVGARLPTSGAGINALVSEVYVTLGELEPAGRVLLTILVAVANLEQGATWVEGGDGSWGDWLIRSPAIRASAFAVAHTPANLMVSVLDDGEGAWDPGTSVISSARGREVLFGLDRDALKARVDAASPAGVIGALDSGRQDEIEAVLTKMPDNIFFREQAWDYLLTNGRAQIVEELARSYARRPGAEVADLRAWIAAWHDRVDDPGEAEMIVRAALDAVRAQPADASLSLLLGLAYEKARPDSPEYARLCYQRVLRIQDWGALGDSARDALERLR